MLRAGIYLQVSEQRGAQTGAGQHALDCFFDDERRFLGQIVGRRSETLRKALEVYFPLEILQYQVKQPLLATNTVENYDIVINLDGGGITGQASAARLGIARALCEIDAEMRPALKKAGFLTRDPREVERKKPGQPGARRKFQFSKR